MKIENSMNYLKNISKSVIVIVSLFATLVAFGTYEKRQASKASAAFCNSVAINSPDNGIKEKAISFGADPRMSVFFVDDNNQHKFIAHSMDFLRLIAAYAKSQQRIILCDQSNNGG